MRALGVTAGLLLLLLLAALRCRATPHGIGVPEKCCFSFYTKRIPESHIKTIQKTHGRCHPSGFLVNTTRGETCVKDTEKWAQVVYNKRHRLTTTNPGKSL